MEMRHCACYSTVVLTRVFSYQVACCLNQMTPGCFEVFCLFVLLCFALPLFFKSLIFVEFLSFHLLVLSFLSEWPSLPISDLLLLI